MKSNNIFLIVVILVIAIVGALLLFGGKKSAATTMPANTGSGTDNSNMVVLPAASNASAIRQPGESWDDWFARRKAEGWSF